MVASLSIRVASTLRPVKALKTKHLGVLRQVRTLKVMAGGVLRTVGQFAAPLSASVSPGSLRQMGYYPGAPIMTLGPATCIVAGGFAPFSYSWAKVSGATFTVSNPTGATTKFTSPPVGPGVTFPAIYRCDVTDSTGQTASAQVSLDATNYGENP